MRTTRFLTLSMLVTGCAVTGPYAYTPRGAATWNDGYPSLVVPERHGTVELASFGITELVADEVGPVPALHVRVVIGNARDDAPWSFDASSAQLEIAGARAVGPIFVNAADPTLPIALVDRGERHALDLYYPLPPGIGDDDDLAGFDVAWRIMTPSERLDGRTHFDRRDATPPPSTSVALAVGWGQAWWIDPRHDWPIFHHESGVLVPRPPTHVSISRPPRWHFRAVPDRGR